VASRKVSISLPEGLYSALQQWASKEQSTPTSLATDIIANALRREISSGNLTITAESDGSQPVALVQMLIRLGNGEKIQEPELAELAHDCNMPIELLRQIRDCLTNGEGKHAGVK
jgi:hypothetical protein